jgi:hypothetical protein
VIRAEILGDFRNILSGFSILAHLLIKFLAGARSLLIKAPHRAAVEQVF